MLIEIHVNVDESSEWVDPDHETGLTEAGFERLYGPPPPLGWLGEVEDVRKVEAH